MNESRYIRGSIKKLFSIDYVNIYLFSIFLNRFCPVEKRGVTLQCLYRDLTFNPWSAQFFKIFEITKAILLHWFAKQQQTSTSRRQQFDLFYPKVNVEFNELSLKL